MAQAKVWNLNTYPLTEEFKGKKIEIPAGKFIEMEFFEAHEFRGQYHAQPVDNDGRMLGDAKYYKMVKVEKIGAVEVAVTHKCIVCMHTSPSEEELEAHIKVRHADAPKLELPEVDEEKKTKSKKAG